MPVYRIRDQADPQWCSHECMAIARGIGFSEHDCWEIGIAVSELATNVLKHAGSGTLTVSLVDQPRGGIELVVEDRGPGIAVPEQAMLDGFSEGVMRDADHHDRPEAQRSGARGLGYGLGSVRRMLDQIELDNRPGGGFKVTGHKWLSD